MFEDDELMADLTHDRGEPAQFQSSNVASLISLKNVDNLGQPAIVQVTKRTNDFALFYVTDPIALCDAWSRGPTSLIGINLSWTTT